MAMRIGASPTRSVALMQMIVTCGFKSAWHLKAEMGESGRSLWDAWSQQSDKYEIRDQDKIWKSFRRNGIGIGTLFYHAKQSGWSSERKYDGARKDGPQQSIKNRLLNFVFSGDEPPALQAMLIDGVMPLQGLPFIGGQSSAGKTFIAILLACCAASGKPFMGREVKKRVGTVIVAAEGRHMLSARIAAAKKELKLTNRLRWPGSSRFLSLARPLRWRSL